MNFIHFPPTHNQQLTLVGLDLASSSKPSINLVTNEGVWYPNSRVMSYITNSDKWVQYSSSCSKDMLVLGINEDSMSVSLNNAKLQLEDLLLVPTTSRNLLSVRSLCLDNNVMNEFDRQMIKVWEIGTRRFLLKERCAMACSP